MSGVTNTEVTPSEVSIDDLAAAQAAGAQVVDVREPAEYVAGHVPGAALIPMGRLVNRLAEIDRSSPVFVICQSGGRSSAMTDVLLHRGFAARSVTGGTTAWVRSGRPVEVGAPREDVTR